MTDVVSFGGGVQSTAARYPLAKHDIFRTIQGEGAMLGVPMVFVRLAGCSVGCPQCDTDYLVYHRLTAHEIGERIKDVRGGVEWVWITGGEPADHDLRALLETSRLYGRVALATSGTKGLGGWGRCVDFLSVSPHGKPEQLVIQSAAQINLVPGLNGLRLLDWEQFDFSGFQYRYVTPLFADGQSSRLIECMEFIERHPGFRLGIQAHKTWGIA